MMIRLASGMFLDLRRVIAAYPASEGGDEYDKPMELVVEGLHDNVHVSGTEWRRICDRLGVR